MTAHTGFAENEGVEIHYQVEGSGPPLQHRAQDPLSGDATALAAQTGAARGIVERLLAENDIEAARRALGRRPISTI